MNVLLEFVAACSAIGVVFAAVGFWAGVKWERSHPGAVAAMQHLRDTVKSTVEKAK